MAGCRIFDGVGYYSESANGTDYQGLSGFTIAAWVYRAASAQYSYPWGISNGTGSLIALYWWMDNSIYMDVRNGSTRYRAASMGAVTGWYHIAGVFDGSEADADRMKIYVNGTQQATTGTTSNPTTTATLSTVYGMIHRIPTFSPAVASAGHAYAHVSIYNVALTEKEINELMFKPASPQRGRLHYWALNGNETASNHNEADMQRIHYLTGNNMASTSASMLSPRVCIGGSAQCL